MTFSPSVIELAMSYFDPPPADDGQASDRELALRCSKDLRVFIREAWPLLEPARPFVASWHIDCVAEHLMAVSAGEIPRLIVNMPPGSSKSSVISVLWPAWEWLTKPSLRWIVASYAQHYAFRDSRKMRQLVESRSGQADGGLFERRGYQGVLGLLGQGWGLAVDQNAKGRYDTTAGGMRLSTSVGGREVTGNHGDRVVIDDPLNPEMARSTADRERVNRWWDETMISRFIDEHASAVLVMQRLAENDLTGHLLGLGGWHHLVLPAEYIAGHQFTYPAKATLPSGRVIDGDPRTQPGELLDPVRINEAVLSTRRGNSWVYAGQFQQQPAPEGGGLFKRDWLTRRWIPDELPRLEHGMDRFVQSWDMAFKATSSSDYVVGQLWGFHGADCYLLAQIRGRLDFTATLHAVRALTAFEPRATAKLVEDKANGTAVINTLRQKVTGLIAIEPEGGKLVRASAVSPRLEAGNVILPASDTIPCPDGYADEAGAWHAFTATTVQDVLHEWSTFPASAHDDMVDAMTQALTWANPQARQAARPEDRFVAPTSIMGGVLTTPFIYSAI